MKLWTPIENTASAAPFYAEHGLSLYIETDSHKILFDMGQTGAFADNAETLGINLEQVDLAVLSHGHYDHSGGLQRFLELNSTAPVFISPWAFEGHYNADGKNIGVDRSLLDSNRLVFAQNGQVIGNGLTLYDCRNCPIPVPIDPFGLSVMREGKLVSDDFRHEQYLLIQEGSRRILVSGCSHKGIRNLVRWFKPDVLIGGFHFMKLEDRRALSEAADDLMQYPTTYYTGHCTGEIQFEYLKDKMGDRLIRISAGMALTV